ncbi:UNVERIFIED_CONTAM: hypothetical protein FKN15_046937 [Acipenser sinensis]
MEIEPHDSASTLRMAVRDLIRSVFQCDMYVFDAYMPEKRNVTHLFQWSVSRGLCSPPACDQYKREEISDEGTCKKMCSKTPFDKVEEACKSYSHVVLKEVRIFDLESLYPLLKDPSLNLKIIHVSIAITAFHSTHYSSQGEGLGNEREAFLTTSRNALNVSQAWRLTLPYEKVAKIQEVCKGAMNMLGYQLVESDKEQKRLWQDMLLPRKQYQFTWLSSNTTDTLKD